MNCSFWCIYPPPLSQTVDDNLNPNSSLPGSKRVRTTAYHPQTNGMVERFHRQLKAALKSQPNPATWMDSLPLVLLSIRTALKEDISSTASDMVYGTTLRLLGHHLPPPIFLTRPILFQTQSPRPISPNGPHTSLMDCQNVHMPSRLCSKALATTLRWTISSHFQNRQHFTIALHGHNDSFNRSSHTSSPIDTNILQSSRPTHST